MQILSDKRVLVTLPVSTEQKKDSQTLIEGAGGTVEFIREPMVTDGIISEGMIPKLQNAFDAINDGVSKVVITSHSDLSGGTTILADPETDD